MTTNTYRVSWLERHRITALVEASTPEEAISRVINDDLVFMPLPQNLWVVACRYPMALLLPFIWQMQNKSLYVSIEKTDLPDNREYIAGLPAETWDQYVREGKQSFAYFVKVCRPVDDWLTRKGITGSDARMAALGAAVFVFEGAKLNRQLLFEGLDEITEAVEQIDYRNVGLSLDDGRELAQLIMANHDILHEARQRVVTGTKH